MFFFNLTEHNKILNTEGRVYYVDLLRATAIMLVFTAHTINSYGNIGIFNALEFGGTGVDLFFLLSGWLIGSQLFSEHNKFKNILVLKFWLRRWMRTLPAYFAVLFVTLLQLYSTKENVANPLPYFFLIQNYFKLEYFTISWSLAVEEQFYLFIAPLTVAIFFTKKEGIRLFILVFILIMPSIFRLFDLYESATSTHIRMDCCIMGVLIAYIQKYKVHSWEKLAKYAGLLCTLGFIAYVSFFIFRIYPPFSNYSDPSKLILALVFSGLLIKAICTPVSRLPFIHPYIMHISTRSYSMYLLHPEALAISKRFLADQAFLTYYLVSLATSLVLAEALYRAIEIPFINLRDRFTLTAKRT